jgi:SNF2 family DNA or RNA helicase
VPNFRELREQIRAAQKVASELEQVAILDESLVNQTRANLSKAKESSVLQKLAQLPIENMRDATDSSLRIETLRKFGITSVASVYHASESQLERISGISADTAKELKLIADRMYEAIAESITYGIKVDDLTVSDLNLLENVQGLEGIRSKLRGNHTKLRPLADSLKNSISDTKPLGSKIIWFFSGSEKRQRALDAITNIAFVLGEPTTGLLASLANDALNYAESKKPDPAIEDFKKRSSDYYAVLEDIGGAKPQLGQRHLNQELIEKIENEVFDSSSIKATLRKYQVFGSKFALTQSRVIIGDEMGLGKTMQAIGVLTQRSLNGANRFLIVCPASVLVNWQREIESRSDLKVVKIHGDEQKSGFAIWKQSGGAGLTTYDTLKAFDVSDEDIKFLEVDTIIVDEAHYVKNAETGRTKTIVKWLDRAPRVMFLTGTPLENRVSEFVSLASLLDREFAVRMNHAALAAGTEVFRQHVAPMYLRRNTEEVLKELPELIKRDEYCSWNGANYENYCTAVARGNFMGMRMAGFEPIRPGVVPDKLERLLEITKEAFENGKKVVIFSYFRSVLNLVTEALGENAIGPITGAVSPAQRQALVDRFTDSQKPVALIGQIQAAGTGLNIQAASVVIICEPQIKPSLEVQAIARAHRMGQVNVVQVHRLVIPESVDEIMVGILNRKQAEFDAYAKESALANSVKSAKDKDEESVARVILLKEKARLGLEEKDNLILEEEPPQG